MQRKLLISAVAFLVVMGAFALLAVRPDTADAATKKKKASPTPTIIKSPTPTPSPTPKPSGTVSPQASASPTPVTSPSPVGSIIRLWQLKWKTAKADTNPVTIVRPTATKNKKGNASTTTGAVDGSSTSALGKVAKTVTGGSRFGGDGSAAVPIQACLRSKLKSGADAAWTSYMSLNNVKLSGTHEKAEAIIGTNKAADGSAYLISSVFQTNEGDTTQWQNLNVYYNNPKAGNVKIYYRVSDDGGTSDAGDPDWLLLGDPKVEKIKCADSNNNQATASYNFNQIGKYFQYKIEPNSKQDIKTIWFDAQPMKGIVTNDDSTPKPSVSPTVAPTSAAGSGKLTIITKRLLPAATPSASPTSRALLPQITPSTKPTATASAAYKPNPACFDDENTEPAANIDLSVRQVDGGNVKIEDQQTDEDGLWKGLDGEIDDFPAGTYQLKFGKYEQDDYKLVDICVSPNDGSLSRKTETSASGARATVYVKNAQETKVVLLYAPRDQAYITMNKFAINDQNKVLKVVYPGMSFRYLIRYENTGETDAKDLVVRDVIPEQLNVAGLGAQDIDTTDDLTLDLDAQGRTMIVKKIGKLAKGQKGSFVIPVSFKSDAFGSVDDLTSNLSAIKNGTNGQSSDSAATPKANDSSATSGSGSDLNLQ